MLASAAAIAVAQGRSDDALAMLHKALALDSYAGGPGERGRSYVAIARILAGQGRWAEAVDAFAQAQALPLRFIWQREAAAAMTRRDGNSVAAEAYLRRSIAQTPDVMEAYVGLVDTLHSDGRVAEAISLGESTIRRFPEAIEPLLVLGQIYAGQQRYADAEAAFRQVVTLRPRLADARLWLVRVALDQQQTQKALALLDEALRISPDNVVYLLRLGDVRRAAGDARGAAVAYRRVLALDPQNSAAAQALESLP